MKKKPCEFCEVEQFIMINGKDAQMSIEFYPDNALFDVVATACDALGEPTEVAWQETFEYCPKCGRKLR